MALQALTARTLLVVDVDDPSTAEREVDTALPSACEEETFGNSVRRQCGRNS